MGRHEEWEYRCGRFCGFSRQSGRLEFARTGSQTHYAPDAILQLQSVKLDLEVDPAGGTLVGKATNTLRVLGEARAIRLDAVGLEVRTVSLTGGLEEASVSFEASGHSLWVRPKGELRPGLEVAVTVDYSVRTPKRGLYFTGPTRDYPKKPVQVWTQGEDEDNRYWFPTLDHPSQRAKLETRIRVPKGYFALSNGALVEKKSLGNQESFHYRLDVPVVTYLTTLVIGEFEGWTVEGPGGLPVEYYVEKGRRPDGERSFSRTPEMISVFEQKTGVAYPFPKYAQIAVQDFIFGGMENASATTQTDQTLHDARAALDFSSDPLVSHELAHQWFGDLVTCRDWAHAWLNEGFATFMERVWVENDPSVRGGSDEAVYYGYLDWKDYSDDDAHGYRRPIVCNRYLEPQDLFDTHLYQKGGLVLNLLRSELGEASFWGSVSAYLKASAGRSVDTQDLIRAIEGVTGRNMRRFFDQWVFGAGYPELEVDAHWDGDKKALTLKLQQKQESLFHFGFRVEAFSKGAAAGGETLQVTERSHEVRMNLPQAPDFVRVDPGSALLKSMKFKRPREMALAQISGDPDPMGRIEAAQFLVEGMDRAGIEALVRAFKSEKFWGVQAEIAACLAKVGSPAALDGLLSALPAASHPKARVAVVRALGKFKDPRALAALQPIAASDSSYFVESAAVLASARLAAPQPSRLESLVSELEKKLKVESYREVIRKAALQGLAELPGLGRIDGDPTSERVRELLFEWARPPKPMEARVGAVLALGSVLQRSGAAVQTRIAKAFDELIDEGDFRLQGALLSVLGDSESPHAPALLSKIQKSSITTRLDAGAEWALRSIEMKRSSSEKFDDLKKQLDELRQQTLAVAQVVKEKHP